MLPTTTDAIKAVLKSDPTISTAQRSEIISLIRNGKDAKAEPEKTPGPRILSTDETAKRLGDKTTRYVRKLAEEGLLLKVKLPGRKRSSGILESSLLALLTNNQVAA